MRRRPKWIKARLAASLAVIALGAGLFPDAPRAQTAAAPALDTLDKLGQALFADRNLSISRTQSCVSCHSPELALTDPKELGKIEGAVSVGADGHSFGDRNSPSVAYASFTPEFHIAANGEPMGGFFWDGRARTLEEQAGGPPLNPIEMGMPDKQSVVARIKENPRLADAFRSLFGAAVFDDTDRAFEAMTKAIAAFERTADISPFDSKYDRSLRGEATLTAEETLGRDLFFSPGRASCGACHLSNGGGPSAREVFTGFKYYNIGTPANRNVRALNGSKPGFVDSGAGQQSRGLRRISRWQVQSAGLAQRGDNRALHAQRHLQGVAHGPTLPPAAQPGRSANQPRNRPALGEPRGAGEPGAR